MTKRDDTSGRHPTVFVCRECKGHGSLSRFLHEKTEARIREVGCQDVCKEPVCGLRVDGSQEWFGGMDDKTRQKALAQLLADSRHTDLPGPLAKARMRKRSGKAPR